MSEVENQTEEAVEPTTLATMPGADNHPTDEKPAMSLDFSEELKAEVEPEPEPTPEPVEAEAEAKEEVEAKAEPEPEPAPEKKSPMIPKARLDEALQKQKALQKQLEELTQVQPQTVEEPEKYDFAAKEIEYQELLLDGEAQKAAELRGEINNNLYKNVMYNVQQNTTAYTQQAITENTERGNLQDVANQLAKKYPSLDENSDQHNPQALEEVLELRDAFIGKGYEPADALRKSVNYVVKVNDIAESTSETVSKKAPQDEVAKKRAEVQRKLEAAEAQPPELMGESGASKGEKNIDISTLSDEEFAALPEATLARLRGDLL